MNNYTKGIFITKVGAEIIKQKLEDIIREFQKYAPNKQRLRHLCKKVCYLLIDFLGTYFENKMWSVNNYKRKLNSISMSDNIETLQKDMTYINSLLFDLKLMLSNTIPLKDFPSCKGILEIKDKDIAVKCAKDLVQNNIISKSISNIVLIDKAKNVVTIDDVAQFYLAIYQELKRLNDEEHWSLSSIEQTLLSKAREELGYCYLAYVKTSIEIAQEVRDLIKDENQANNYISSQYNNLNNHLLSPTF
ncbi:MAG: hypothetical protein IJ180_10075 [Bacteroidales bacterium]|nr:hypothetical protein [Bacteroidales bacterium]